MKRRLHNLFWWWQPDGKIAVSVVSPLLLSTLLRSISTTRFGEAAGRNVRRGDCKRRENSLVYPVVTVHEDGRKSLVLR